MKKDQHCFNCGEYIGHFDSYGEPDTCGSQECNRELRYALECERAERMEAAADDDYARY